MSVSRMAFHPMRYAQSRLFSTQITRFVSSVARRSELPDKIDCLTPLIGAELERAHRHLGPLAPERPILLLADEIEIAETVALFTAYGRNVFALTPTLVELLAGTGLGDVQLQDLVYPFDCFYLGFGDALDAALPGGANQIDEAYILVYCDAIAIRITSRRLDVPPRARSSWVSHHEPQFTVRLGGEPGASIEECSVRASQSSPRSSNGWARSCP